VLASAPHVIFEQLSDVVRQTCGDLVILPNDMESLELATHLAADVRETGRRVAVIPTVAQVQGLAAVAVHEPAAEFDSAVVAMSSAAGHTRHGALTVAESPAMTMAGRCETGDVLGLVEGDFVEIGDSLVEVGWRVIQRLLAAGGELLTLVSGAGADPLLLDELVLRARSANPTLDVEVIAGGQARYPVLVGFE
jgi:dihydroxyacetone kinase-like predicted kinase